MQIESWVAGTNPDQKEHIWKRFHPKLVQNYLHNFQNWTGTFFMFSVVFSMFILE